MSDQTKPGEPTANSSASSAKDSTTGAEPVRTEPTLAQLMAGNLKIVGWSLVLAISAYALWRGAAWLFPDISWLQIDSHS